MPDPIFPLTSGVLESMAQEAAEHGVPLAEANYFEHGSALWSQFNQAYEAAMVGEAA